MRLLLFICCLLITAPAFAAPKVVVSITPIHALTRALTKGITKPHLLLPQAGSPHSGSLRPSQAKALASADLLIWVGPELESFLSQPILRLVKPQARMQLLTLKKLNLLKQRKGGFWDEDQHGDTEETHHFNPHIWLSPQNASLISAAITERLIQLDPQNEASYKINLQNLQLKIAQFSHQLKERLKPIQKIPYPVFHDAYPYFEKAFALNALGSIRVSADRPPGAARLTRIQQKIATSQAVCLFSE
ncbi:MAG: zinc ABC transporter substrate-binding protein, partial [Geopsychrobacter sp.]|nr:zinc ABC transporter substrate-binding protein [Geopsychrobacter sp.]